MTDKLELLLKGALMAIEDATIVSDVDGDIKYISKQAGKLLGLPEDIQLPLQQELNLKCYEFGNGDTVQKTENSLEEILARGEFSNLLLQLQTAKNDQRIISFTARQVRDENQNVIGTVLKLNDLSLRLQGAEDRRASDPSPFLSEYAGNASDIELESFIYSVSHDLQAPLRHIQGFSELLQEECSDCISDEGKSYIMRMQTACTSIQHQIVNLLQLSRNTRGRMLPSTVNLSDIAREILEGLSRKHYQREVNIVIEPDIEVVGDQRLLIVLMQQLLDNAWKFTSEKSKGCIEFGVTEVDGKRTFFIYDNGIGINKRRADKLFLPFKKLNGNKYPGKGIGLATVLRIINRHGGKIWFETEYGQSTTFFFHLG